MKNNMTNFDSWKSLKIQDICDVTTGGTPRTNNPDYWDGDINWMASGEVNKRRIKFVDRKITKAGLENSNARILPRDSIMIALAGQGKTRGKAAILDTETTCNQSLAALIIKDKSRTDPEYLFQNLENLYEDLRSLSGGEGRTGLNLTLIKNFQVLLPPISLQKTYSGCLQAVDEEITITEDIIEKTQKLKDGFFVKLFSSELNGQKHINKKLAEVLDFSQYGLSLKSSQSGKYPMLRMNNFENGKLIPFPLVYVELDKKTFATYKLEKGDILFNRTNSQELVGKTGIFELEGDYVFASYLVRLRANSQLIKPEYLNYYLNSPYAKRQIESMKSRGVSQSNINPTVLKSRLNCPVPTIKEQQEVVDILDSIDMKLILENKRKEKLLNLKAGLMRDIFSQKVQI